MTKSDSKVDGPSPVSRSFGPGLGYGCEVYKRERHLPLVMVTKPQWLEDHSEQGTEHIIRELTVLAKISLNIAIEGWPHELRKLVEVVSVLRAERQNLAVIVARKRAALRVAQAHSRETRGAA